MKITPKPKIHYNSHVTSLPLPRLTASTASEIIRIFFYWPLNNPNEVISWMREDKPGQFLVSHLLLT